MTRRLFLAGLAALVGVIVTVVGVATPASAHGQFVSADPAKDSTVAMPLASIVLWFTEKPTSNAFFAVTAPSGARVDRLWSHGSTRRLDTPVHEYFHNSNGNWETRTYNIAYTALVPIAYWPETGAYKVTFISVATDGEPVRGDYTFNYTGAITAAPADFRPQKNEADPNLLAVTKADQPTAPASAGPIPADGSDPAADDGPGVWVVLIPVALALLVAAGMVVYWFFRPQARKVLVSRFGGRYAAPPAPRKPLQLPPQLEQLRDKLPIKRR